MIVTNAHAAVPVTIRHWGGESFDSHRVPISVTHEAMPGDSVILGEEEFEYRCPHRAA